MKIRITMLTLILIAALSLAACNGGEEEVEESEVIIEEEIEEETEPVIYNITPGDVAILLVERVISEDVHEDLNQYFYNADNIEEEIAAWLEAKWIPKSVAGELHGEELQRFTENIDDALRQRTTFDVLRVNEHPERLYSVFVNVYGVDYDYLNQVAEDSAFRASLRGAMLQIPEVDNLSDFDIDADVEFDLEEEKTFADYLAELSEFARTTPRSMEVEIILRHHEDGLWEMVYLDDMEKIVQALLVERGYVFEGDGRLERVDGEPDSILVQRLLSDGMRDFEAANGVTSEQEWALAFGAFYFIRNVESARILELRDSGTYAGLILRNRWGVTDGESALRQIRALSEGQSQTLVANEIWNEVILTQNVTLDDIWDGQVSELLEHTNHANRDMIEEIFDFIMADEDFLDQLEDDEDYLDGRTVEEYVYEIAQIFAAENRIVSGFEAFEEAAEMLIGFFDFTEEDLVGITSLAAWDYGRVAIVARYAVAMGYLEEEEVWPYLQAAAISASETYSDWREFTAAYILGRALASGNGSHDFIYTLDFLLNHSESPFQRLDFQGD